MEDSTALETSLAAEPGGETFPTDARTTRMPQTFRSLQHRNFQLYFAGQLISVAGTWMQVVAQAWLVYELSHSELMLGLVGFAAAIPSLLISPWGGVVAEDCVMTSKLRLFTRSTTTPPHGEISSDGIAAANPTRPSINSE